MPFKNAKIILYICIGFFIATVLYFFMSRNRSSLLSQTATTTAVIQKNIPTFQVESFAYSTSSIDLTVEYVQIAQTTSTSSSLELMLNANFKNEAKKLYEEQLRELKQSLIPDSLGWEQRSVTFERKVAKERIFVDTEVSLVSLVYTNYIDTGGAHGTFFYGSETVDLATGKKLVLKDFLQGDYESVIMLELENQIQTSSSTDTCVNCYAEFVDQATEMFISKNFILTKQGVMFLYGAYDLGAYALTSAGQEILVSNEVLQDFVSRDW
jgi:hypothetical protein